MPLFGMGFPRFGTDGLVTFGAGTPANSNPATPTVTAGTLTSTGATLTGSAFSDPDVGDTHAATQWRITRVSDAVVVYNPGDDAVNKTSLVWSGGAAATDYTAEARYKDSAGNYSAWATSASFTTAAAASNFAIVLGGGSSAGIAPNDSSIAAAPALAFIMRLKGSKLTTAAAGAAGITDFFEVYSPSPLASKFEVILQGDGVGGVQIRWIDPAIGQLTPASYCPGASLVATDYYVVYVHEDASQTNRQYAAIYHESSPGVVDPTPVWTGNRTNTYITGLPTTAGYGGFSLNKKATTTGTPTAGTYDWCAIFSAAQSGAAQYTKPAPNAAGLLALWEFNEGTGTTAANSKSPIGTAQAMTVPNNWVSA